MKIGLKFSTLGLCFWLYLLLCPSRVMAEGIPYSTYGANSILFYDPCMFKSDDGGYGDGTSYKINPDTPAGSANTEGTGGFWYLEGTWSSYPKTKIYTNNGDIVPDNTKIDKDFFDMPYIYAENYDYTYNPWPTKMTPNGKHSTRKYYWIVLPNEAYVRHQGDLYVAYFEKRKEPLFFITYDVWSCGDHYLRKMHYCDWAREDPNNVNGGLANNSLGHFSERGSNANDQLGDALGKLTCLHRITTEGETLAHESASCSGSIDLSSDSKKEEKDAEKGKKSSDSGKKTEDTEDDSDEDSSDDKTEAASSDVKLHKPKNAWLDKAGLEGFKVIKALNSKAGNKHIDSSAMKLGTDKYTSFASSAGDGTGLPGFIVLHWTAVNGGDYSWTNFCGGDKDYYCPPHFTIDVVKKEIQQYFPLSSPSAAVAGTKENKWDQYGIQIEVVGSPYDTDDYGHNKPEYNIYNFTDEQYDYLAKLLIAISKETGIPLKSSLKWYTGQGGDIAPKLTAEETKKYIGVLGHEHLPDQSGKWDPGKMWEYVEKALGRLGYKYDADGENDGELVCPGDEKEQGGCGGAKIAEVAKELAWPDGNHHDQIKPEFAAAAIEVGIPSAATVLSGWSGGAQDCGRFTGVVVRKAVDPNYPKAFTPDIEEYLSNSSLWKEIPNIGSESNMEPGDVMIGNAGSYGYGSTARPTGGAGGAGHAQIYVGDGKLASASLDTRTGDLSKTVYFSSPGKYVFRIFRYIGDGDCDGEEDDSSSGTLKEDIKKLEKSGIKVGVAVTKPGNKKIKNVKKYGSYKGGRAWSTIKVPLAIAAIQENASTGQVTDPYGGRCNHTLDSAVTAAITKSDNCAAWWLWVALGGDGSSAAGKVTAVIKAGGDSSTSVVGNGDGHSLTSGKTTWTLKNQALFAANMASISKSSDVLKAMKKHNATDGSHGLASNYTSMIKGGWGSADGAATRQFGLIKLKNKKCTAVAIGTNQGSSFSILDKIVKVLLNHEDDLPSGKCPKGL